MKIAVIGAGVMGRGISQAFAQAGHEVSMVDRTREVLARGLKLVGSSLVTLAEYGAIQPGDIQAILDRIHPTTELVEGVRDARFVAEVVSEVPELKKLIILRLDEHCPGDVIIMSNTSSLDVFGIAADFMSSPERLIMAHWYAPAHIMPLVEVAPGPKTSPKTVKRTAELMEEIGKIAVVMRKFAPGFVVNKIQHGFARAMFSLLESEVVDPAEIDKAIKYVLGVRLPIVGIIQSMDFNGLDTVYNICKSLGIDVPSIARKVADGDLGASTGRGMYDYQGRTEEEILKKRDTSYLKTLDFLRGINAFEPI